MNGLPPHRRLAFQLALTVALVASTVFGATGWFVVERQRDILTHELTLRVLAETRALAIAASSALLRHDPELELHPLVTRVTQDVEELVDLMVIDAEGVCQGHVDLARIGTSPEPLPFDTKVVLSSGRARAYVEGDVLHVERTIEHLDRTIGTLRATVDRGGVQRTVAASLRGLALTGAIGIVLGIVLVLLLVTQRLRPLARLREGVQRIGAGDLATRVETGDRTELGHLAWHVNAMAEGLARAQEERIRQERIDRELEIAHQIQETLLPRRLPQIEGLSVAAHYSPALEVSGDYYDVFAGPDGRVWFVTADVSGKGVPGMVVMAMTKVVLRQLAAVESSPAAVLRRANSILVGLTPRQMFVTVALGTVDPGTGEVVHASAGHCPPIRFGDGNAEELHGHGKPLGIFPAAVFDRSARDVHSTLGPGQTILLYTDGLTEAEGPGGEQLGEDHVLASMRALGPCASASIEHVIEDVRRHRAGREANDDLTLLAIERVQPAVVVSR